MKHLLIKLLLVICLGCVAVPKELSNHTYQFVYLIFKENNMDINSKSPKGWIRVFNSNEKLKDYNFNITLNERKIVLEFFKNKLLLESEHYERGEDI